MTKKIRPPFPFAPFASYFIWIEKFELSITTLPRYTMSITVRIRKQLQEKLPELNLTTPWIHRDYVLHKIVLKKHSEINEQHISK